MTHPAIQALLVDGPRAGEHRPLNAEPDGTAPARVTIPDGSNHPDGFVTYELVDAGDSGPRRYRVAEV